ncbi:MAG TPA: sigma 54-interacting transcriptional regulator [Candidatus Polarisedimenticolia bacterium]|nr:sigma 54-interacting transcriptional regulator [Candidatus Polarisedimenticolia bacterium]
MSELAQDSESQELSDALEKLRGEAARLQTLIDTVPSFLWTSFPDGSKELLNRRWYEYTGLTLEQGKGWGWKVVVHPDDLDRLVREWLALLSDPKPGELETRIRRFDGEYRWFLIRVLPEFDAEGNVVRWLGSDTDIEDRKRAETKLLKDERELRRITDAIPHTIVVLDPKGNALYANRAMLDYTGLTMQDVLASGFRARTFHPEDLERVGEEREGGFARGLPFEIELRVLRKDGQYHWLLLRYNPLRDEEERLVRWYATGTDIDDRKRAEDRTRNENVALREDIVRSSMFEEIVGSSEPLRRVLVEVSKVAPTDSTVLVLGETGTGKELIARAIHNRSKRSNRAFIRVNCAAIPQSLIASELFGHEKGSFTGATQRRLGRFESADGGTIFLDEVGDLPPETQVALLRVLQEREFERVGGTQSVSVDVRVVAATNRDLTSAVAEGRFRQDLFYRLNVFPIRLPALRERISDISLLVGYLIDRYAKKLGKKIRNVDKKTIELFHAYDWPGNIRELQNVVERAVILSEGETFFVDETWLTHVTPKLAATTAPLVADLVEHEREILEAALRESEGVVGGPTGAAFKLGIPRQTLESKIRKLGINRHRFKAS